MPSTIMYDTIKFVLRAHQLANGITSEVFKSIKERIQQREKYFTVAAGQESFKGKLEGWNVKISPSRLEIEGSFQKFVTGDQLTPMTPKDVEHGIRKLSELFGLPMELAIISRLDIAINIATERHPAAYYAYLGEMKGKYDRKRIKNTLYYQQSKSKTVAFYDKVKEMKTNSQKRGLPLPADLPEGNLLRIEFRILKDLKTAVMS